MTHMVIPCLLLAEVYLIDCPHNSRWWATKCSGGVTVQNINCWKRDVLVTMKYWLYVEPTKHFVNWTRQVKKLAFNLFGQNAWQYHMGSLNSTSKMVKRPSSPSIKKSSSPSMNKSLMKLNDRPVAMEITTDADTTDLKESKENNNKTNAQPSALKAIAEISNTISIPSFANTNTNIINKTKSSSSKNDISPKGSEIKTNTSQKSISRSSSSSSFHRSLQNHLNANSGLSKNNSNYFSIQNLLSNSFPFNKPNDLSSGSVLATTNTSSLLTVINNNATCKMASPTGGTSFKLLGVRDSTGHNSNNGASTSGTNHQQQMNSSSRKPRPVSMPVTHSNGRMSISNMINNNTTSIAPNTSTNNKSIPIIPNRRNSFNIYQSPATMYSSMDNNTQNTSSIANNIGRSHTIKFTSSRFSGNFDQYTNNRSTLSSTLALIRENSEEQKDYSSKPEFNNYSYGSEITQCNPQDSMAQSQNPSYNNSRFLANTSFLSDLTCVSTNASMTTSQPILKDSNVFSSPSMRGNNTTTATTSSSSLYTNINNNNDNAYQHLKSYLKSSTDLSYSGCNGQKIENSLLTNLGLPTRQDSRIASSYSFMGKSQHHQQQQSSLTVPPASQYPANSQTQPQQSSFCFANSQKPPPQPHTNSSAMHSHPVTQTSTTTTHSNTTNVELPPFLETINQGPTPFHYPFQSSPSSRNKNVSQGQMQVPPQFQNQNQNQEINYQSSYEVPTPGRSNSDSSNVPSIYSSTNVTPFSPKSFTSSELNSTLSTTTSVTRNSSLNTTITTSSYESNPSVKMNNDNYMPTYMDYKKMAYLPSNFNPHCTQSVEEPSSLDNSNYVEQNNTIFKDPFFKNLVKNELENSSSQVSHESFRSDSMEIDEEKKILSPPTTPN
ncbi:hypothetical protein PIROE2DRAFT_65555 [Piromyces sp. E2]|nr:hypothetical protein PIROE2DRAFT_65555 [Piromyces sp. E2]|eukprot:OUM56400.1 hypothetical protein PIROE2DRAFT_65555 [Piromyces sp. E2]